ncbi:MAG: hypothetical protein U0587_06945 [Candidatus Binatia bacterium]
MGLVKLRPWPLCSTIVPLSWREMVRMCRIARDEAVDYLVEFGKHPSVEANPHQSAFADEIGTARQRVRDVVRRNTVGHLAQFT